MQMTDTEKKGWNIPFSTSTEIHPSFILKQSKSSLATSAGTHNVSSILLTVCVGFICWRSLVCLGRQQERTICVLFMEQDVFIPREVWRYKWYLLCRTHYFYGVTWCLFKPLVLLRRCSFSFPPKSYQQRAWTYLGKMSKLQKLDCRNY